MKTISVSFIAALMLMFTTLSLNAGNDQTDFRDQSIVKIISLNMSYPPEAVAMRIEGVVNVTFEVDENGAVVIHKIVSEYEVLKQHVAEELVKMSISEYTEVHQLYSLNFIFRLI